MMFKDKYSTSFDTSLDLTSFWLPFTSNRQFKARPRLFKSAKGLYLYGFQGEKVLDAASGLWCCNAGHMHPKITEAIHRQMSKLDFLSPIGLSFPEAFTLASKIDALLPSPINKVFFTNSGSEGVDTAIKVALLHSARLGNKKRIKLIGSHKAYHGAGFGGLSVGGCEHHNGKFGPLLSDVDHLAHLGDLPRPLFVRGVAEEGGHHANELEALIKKHGEENIAAVIVEPVKGCSGIHISPKNYLQNIRKITNKYKILLIFDEVITAFGRLGVPSAAEYFGVVPDIIVMAKALTNGAAPMGAVAVKQDIYENIVDNSEDSVEFDHGYTFSAHPLAVAASNAALDVYESEGLYEKAALMGKTLEGAAHSLKDDSSFVLDIRNIGMMAAIDLDTSSHPSIARQIQDKLIDDGVYIRANDSTLKIVPPLISDSSHIEQIFEKIRSVIKRI